MSLLPWGPQDGPRDSQRKNQSRRGDETVSFQPHPRALLRLCGGAAGWGGCGPGRSVAGRRGAQAPRPLARGAARKGCKVVPSVQIVSPQRSGLWMLGFLSLSWGPQEKNRNSKKVLLAAFRRDRMGRG